MQRLEQRFGCRLTAAERAALMALAERAERRPSDMLRLLLRCEAQRAGLWPEKQTAQSVKVSQNKTESLLDHGQVEKQTAQSVKVSQANTL